MSVGWVKLYRKTLESRVFANEGLLKVWIYCLLRANHKNNWVNITTGRGSTEIYVPEGSFIYGRHAAADELSMPPSTVHSRMQKLQEIGNINIQPDTHCSLVSLCNWETYQDSKDGDQHPSNNQVTTNRQPSNTDKNDKNEKKYCYGDSEKWDEEKSQPIDYMSFLEAFNDLYDKQLRMTEEKRESIRGRLRTFTGQEIRDAWENRANDDWLNEEGKKYLGNWSASMRNDEKIDRYLNGQKNDQQKIFKPVAN